MSKLLIASLLILFTLQNLYAKSIFDIRFTPVREITSLNFKKQIIKTRESSNDISVLLFYKHNDGQSKQFAKEYETFAEDFQGVFFIGSVDCAEQVQVCEQEKVAKFPSIKIYPPQPVPIVNYEGELDIKKIIGAAAKYINNNVIQINSTNINTFINDSPSVPKVLLFSEKKTIPLMYKGLSNNFEKKLFFGIISKDDEILMERYNIKKVPQIIVVKTTEKVPRYYKGAIKYKEIFNFLNIDSQAFVPGGGSSQDSAATKAWLTEITPEMTYQSANDICLTVKGGLCVILLSQGKAEKQYTDLMKQLYQKFDRKIERGIQFKFMWLDVSIEKDWQAQFNYDAYPKLIVLNPGVRKRFVDHSEELTYEEVEKLLDRIIGGDARFSPIKAIPEFFARKE